MSVLIKGMDMPKWCGECRFSVDGWCYAHGKPNVEALSNDGITNWCPLVEVPTPHGRLIDADALDYSLGVSDEDIYFSYILKDAPTVIESEE